jgi:tetratricopeptide (TPR) repeat protein
LFNLATIQAEQKNNDKALELYQKALDIDPESIEVKTNMELLTQQDSGGGGGQDDKQQDKKNDKDKKGGEGDKKDDQKNGQNKKNDEKFENPRPTPRPYQSEEISQQDMKRILEELKRQEGNIRARMDNERKKEAPAAKDW